MRLGLGSTWINFQSSEKGNRLSQQTRWFNPTERVPGTLSPFTLLLELREFAKDVGVICIASFNVASPDVRKTTLLEFAEKYIKVVNTRDVYLSRLWFMVSSHHPCSLFVSCAKKLALAANANYKKSSILVAEVDTDAPFALGNMLV